MNADTAAIPAVLLSGGRALQFTVCNRVNQTWCGMPETVESQLNAARDQLLDLGLSNKLLNYRAPKVASVEIVGEPIEKIWRLLAQQEGVVSFDHGARAAAHAAHARNGNGEHLAALGPQPATSVPAALQPVDTNEGSASSAADESADDDSNADAAPVAESGPRRLRTPHTDTDLGNRLLRLYQASRSAQEELGLNVLFVAAGFLAWKPQDRSDVVRAPIFLLPVSLERATAREGFKLKGSGEDPVFNPCLEKKLDRDFRIKIPGLPESWQDFDVMQFMTGLTAAVAQQPGWVVSGASGLGLFSFSKYMMYMDLAAERWPENGGPLMNPLLRTLCGDRAALAPVSEALPRPEDIDKIQKPETTFQIMDADSSQQAAIAAVKQGGNLVIQGPPGTGKSQTIANILAECMAAGKTALFVSQKRAALEVVKSRLEKAGLGDFCMELHSTKATRAAMLNELERVLGTQPAPDDAPADMFGRLGDLKRRLGDYVNQLHAPIGASERTPYYVFGRLAQLRDVPLLETPLHGCENWDRKHLDALKDLLGLISGRLQETGPVAEHPWFGLRVASATGQLTGGQQNALVEQAAGLADKTAAFRASAAAVTGLLGLSAPQTVAEAHRALAAGELILKSDPACADLVDKALWNKMPREAEQLLNQLRDYGRRREALQTHWRLEQAAALDLPALRARAQKQVGVTRWFSLDYWRDRAAIRKCMSPAYRPDLPTRVADIGALDEFFARKKALEASGDRAHELFGGAWSGLETPPERLVTLSGWLVEARATLAAGELTETGIKLLSPAVDKTPLANALAGQRDAAGALENVYRQFRGALGAADAPPFPATLQAVALGDLEARAQATATAKDRLPEMFLLQQTLAAAAEFPAALPFISKATSTALEPELLLVCFEKQMMSDLAELALAGRDALRLFQGAAHEGLTLEFARLDRETMRQNSGRIYRQAAARRPDLSFEAAKDSQLGIVQGEIRRKRGGRTIRRLLRDAPEAVQRIKPCFMMSPLSVAQYLDPQCVQFDLVIFDEASQVEPADALGAVARGRQLVLVGDSKQLPPTRLFASLESDSQKDAPEEGEAGLTDMESILDRGEAMMPKLALRWHYRSRHESLISFSNSEFYNNGLVVFPSCHHDNTEYGLSMRYEPTDMYDRGKSSTNRAQAARVAEAVFEHAREHPDISLGVAAFSVAQQQAIQDEIEARRKADPSQEAFFAANRTDPFFVKNLETIQGDERDVIFLSVGHGPAVAGQRVGSVSNLNREGGWRRLNVLITRARLRYVVFTSILARDMDIKNEKSRGSLAFQRYLEFVETGTLPVIANNDGEAESPFEEAVYDALTQRGVQLRRQVGSAGYAIDMAVVDPEHPGHYLLGIECDGASYHSAATARDRDRLRQEVLEQLGWRFHRIWSTDWFRQPDEQIKAVMNSIAQAKAGTLKPKFAAQGAASPAIVSQAAPPPLFSDDSAGATALLPGMVVYNKFIKQTPFSADAFYTQQMNVLVRLLVKVVQAEGPIHEDELARRACECYGIMRVGPRVRQRVMDALAKARESEQVKCRGAFIWPPEMTTPPLRWRGEPLNRDFEMIASEEIVLALGILVRQQFAVPREALITQTLRAMGFAASIKNKARVEAQIDAMLQSGLLTKDAEDRLKPPANGA